MAVDDLAVGILQRQPAWGSTTELMTPAVAAVKFFAALLSVRGWETMPPAQVACVVQRSALADAYAADLPAGQRFYHQHLVDVLLTGCAGSQSASAVHGLVAAPRQLMGAGL
ncbi:MAG: hypothetical protein JOZ49_01975 [Mycolicibacterium sp.]|nr:hypothetical protein [Mycolicibacterium sp.]